LDGISNEEKLLDLFSSLNKYIVLILDSTIGAVCGDGKELSSHIIHPSIRCTLIKPRQSDPSTCGEATCQGSMNQVTYNLSTDCPGDQSSIPGNLTVARSDISAQSYRRFSEVDAVCFFTDLYE